MAARSRYRSGLCHSFATCAVILLGSNSALAQWVILPNPICVDVRSATRTTSIGATALLFNNSKGEAYRCTAAFVGPTGSPTTSRTDFKCYPISLPGSPTTIEDAAIAPTPQICTGEIPRHFWVIDNKSQLSFCMIQLPNGTEANPVCVTIAVP
jgi:hypothetical protein